MSMTCPICRTKETKWKNVDALRLKPQGMSMCEVCGFLSYPSKYRSKAEIIEYYKAEYRAPPNINGIYTGERKIQYHAHFLGNLFNQWRESGRKDIVITDVGSAFGMFLNWVKHMLPNAEVLGVELTTSFVRNAWHLFNIKTIPEFDDSRKYDLISSYKSLEHILDPDVELERYIDALKPDGYLYFSVPIWFDQMKNFGQGGFDIEYYYSPNHINTWTRKHVEGLIKVCGGEVVEENRTFYDTTWLIKRNESLKTKDRTSLHEDPEQILESLRRVFEAGGALALGDYAKAVEIWPNCPSAWMAFYEHNRKALHDQGFEKIYTEFLQKAFHATDNDADIHYLAADICARYDQYDKAVLHLNESNKLRPNAPHVFHLLSNCYRTLGKRSKDPETKIQFFDNARKCAKILGDISTQNKGEAMTWMMFDNANIPTPFEVAQCQTSPQP